MNMFRQAAKLPAYIMFMLVMMFSGYHETAYSEQEAKIKTQISSAEKLIEKSSAARQVMESNVPEAWFKYQKARDLLCQGKSAIKNGNKDDGQVYISEAVKFMFAAVRLSESYDVVQPKKITDYKNRKQTVNALMEAHKRIAVEKGVQDKHENLKITIDEIVKSADDSLVNDDLDAAQKRIDEAYLLSKKSIEQMRQGDTLVRSLNFSSKKEEYDYEIDRNDTHKMLVILLLKDKMKNQNVNQMVNKYIEQSDELRSSAIESATSGDYSKAVELLEKSTRELVKAIRSAGVYIPG